MGEYPRVLNGEGCVYGQVTREKVKDLKDEVDGMEKKIDRMTWALAAAAITFGTAALMLGLNLWLP